MSHKRINIIRTMRQVGWLVLGLLALLVLLVRFYPYPQAYPAFPRITHTTSGAPGDPLNVIVVGSQAQLTQSFLNAGWLVPDPITAQSSEKIVAASLAHHSYPTAPVSNLYVFGRVQDLAFERPTRTVSNRGHVRLWDTGTLLSGQPVWIGQASFDQGIELSGKTGLPTHHIAPTVDLERDAVGADLAATGLVAAEAHAAFTQPIFVAFNGGSDLYASDGDVLILTYTHVSRPFTPATGLTGAVSELKRGVFLAYDALLLSLVLALAVAVLLLALLLVGCWPALRWLYQLARARSGRTP